MPSPSKLHRRPAKAPLGPPAQRETTRCILPTLPPHLLVRIFRLAISFDNFLLSKTLLPHTIAALASYVVLRGDDRLASFCVALRRRPSLVDAVEELEVSLNLVQGEDDDLQLLGPQRMLRPAEGLLGRDREELEARKGQRVDVEDFKPTRRLVQDLCRLLPNLWRLRVYSVETYEHLVDAQYLEQQPFHNLRHLELLSRHIFASPDVYKPRNRALFHNLTRIPTLRQLLLDSSDVNELPSSDLGVDASTFVAPRSLYLESLRLENFSLVGVEVRAVFSALAPGLKVVKISARDMYPGLVDNLVRLPPTVTHLSLDLGDECPRFVDPGAATPKFDSPLLALALPKLQHLHLHGPLLSTSTFPVVIHHLPELYCLSFGAHADINGQQLTSLLRGGPPAWPEIRYLTLHIWECASRPSSTAAAPSAIARPPRFMFDPEDDEPHPHHAPSDPPCTGCGRGLGVPSWPARLGLDDMRQIAMIAVGKDIDVRGSAVCAARMCGGDGAEGHRCHVAWARAG
ncbi:hypothetical protein JCM8208_001379 [Rhodotorula glutinis]